MSKFRKTFTGALVAGSAVVSLVSVAVAGKLGLGREASPQEIAGWDIDVRPDGQGLPPGKGTVAQGESIFIEQCAACHGEFGQGVDRWPVLAGGLGSLTHDRPDKTIGSFWPAPSTIYDYVRRAMPYGNAQSLKPDEIYALVAYLLYLNEVVKDTGFELNQKNFASIKLPNSGGFYDDDRETSEKQFWQKDVCMKDCKVDVKVLNHARMLDVTPDRKKSPKVE
ncbi:MAG: cytochrome C [Hyphomicrobium sp.]|nr:MAG: cytochrome C [Hyphomicrobium sp.]